MKKVFIFLMMSFVFYVGSVDAQITIDECQEKAKANYPLIKKSGLVEKTADFNLSNLGKGYLPQFSLSGKATYQSDVPGIPIAVPGVVPIDKAQYAVTLDLNQVIWDGGVISTKKEIAKASAQVEQKQVEVDLYAINNRVNQLFFGILLLDAQLDQNKLLADELQRNYDLITNYIQNGIANQSDLDVVKVEQLKTIQNRTQLQLGRKAYIDVLSAMIGEGLSTDVKPVRPDLDMLMVQSINRPELDLFNVQHNNLEAQRKLITAGNMPKLGFFVTGGYGRPGLNMLENKFTPYYIGGLRLSWNFGGLYTRKNDKRLIDMNQDILAVQKETFLFNTNLEVKQEQNEIDKNRDLLKYDDEIIALRGNVKEATKVKLANGTRTTTDLMHDVSMEDISRQDRIRHEIELLLSVYNLKFTTNN